MKGKYYAQNKEDHYEWLEYFANYILENHYEVSEEAEEQADLYMETMRKWKNKEHPFNK